MTMHDWTDGDQHTLVCMLKEGSSCEDIAIVCGRHVQDVHNMAVTMGLLPNNLVNENGKKGRDDLFRFHWTDHERNILCEMWKAGRTSGEIAKALGKRTRNSVMGMVNRLGLTRKNQTDIPNDFHSIYMQTLDYLSPLGRDEVLLEDEHDNIEVHHLLDIHEDLAFLMAVILHGRKPAVLSMVYEKTETEVKTLLQRLHDRGLWREGEPRPMRWNNVAKTPQVLIMDAMVFKGMMDIAGFPQAPRYRFSESFNDDPTT